MLSKENIEEQVIDNQSRLIRMQKEDTLPSSSQQMLKLPEGFTIGQAIVEGDCFFHAVAQGLKYLKPDINFTIKSLRNICKAFAESQLGLDSSWLTEALKNDGRSISYYIPRIEFTADDIKKRSKVIDRLKLTTAMWGLPDIDGRIICITYDVRLHFIEVNTTCDGENVITQHLIDRGGYQKDTFNSEVFNKEVYYRENTIHIINKGGFHFEPILRGTVEQVLSYYYDTMASEKKLDSESVCFQQISEVEMKDVADNQMDCEYYKELSPGVEVLPADSTIGATVDYEDRLSDKALQYKQSQENPISSRVESSSSTSEDISNSVWYSALTDCGSTVDDIGFIYDEIVERETYFVKTFVKEFEEKLSQYSKEAKPGSQIQELGKIATQSISITNNLIPPNPLRFGLLKLCEGVGFFSAQTHRKESKEVSAIVNEMALKEMRKILVEAGLEIFQSFECQFVGVMDVGGSSWKRGIKKLAMDAVYRVMNYLSTCSKKEDFSVDLITKGLILGESRDNTLTQCVFRKPVELFMKNNDKRTKPFVLKSKIFSNLRKLQPGYRIQVGRDNNELLVTSQLYTEVGIKKIDNDIIEYYQLRKHNNAEKYGYRLFFAWELEKWRNESIDKKYKLVITPEEQYVYILDNGKKEKLANSLLKEINGNDPTKKKDIEDLREEIKDLRICYEKEDKNTFSFNLEHLPQFFVERGNTLKMLNEKLDIKKQEEMPRMVLIHGGYGVGKSELAKSYAHSIKSKGNVVWINAKSCSTLSNSFYSLAKKLGIPTEGYKGIQKINYGMESKEQVDSNDIRKNIQSIVNNVYERLQDVESYFIFDNASQYKEIKNFLPPCDFIFGGKQPYVLITCRNKDWKEEIEKINLDKGFSPAEALMFIEKALEIEDNSYLQIDEMVNLARKLNYSPLALKEATKYIKEEGVSISQYLEHCSKVMKESNLDYLKEENIPLELFTTLKINFDKIKEEKDIGQQSHDILASMAYLSPGPINTVEFFFHEESEKDQQDASNALNLLDKFSMIELDESTAKIHEGVQKTIIIEEERMGITEEILRKIMTSTMDSNTTSVDHIMSVWSYASKYKKLVNDFIDSTYNGTTILHLLAKDGNEEVIKLILEKVDSNKLSKVINAVDKKKCAPLDYAAMYGHLGIVKYFIEKGSDLDGDLTPLHWAAVCGQLEVVEYFIDNEYWRVDKLSRESATPLHYAVISGNMDIVKYLVEKGANVNLQDESAGPLHHAVEEGYLDIVQYLVERGADVNLCDKNRAYPLHYSIKNSFSDITKYLIAKGANTSPRDRDNMSPLCYANKSNRSDIVKYLIKEKAIENLCKKNVMSFLYYGAEDDRLDIAEYLIEKEISIILNKSDKVSMDFFRFDDFYDRLNNIKSLIMRSTMVDPLNKEGMSALYLATIYGRLDLIEQLVRGGADVNEQGREGMCPLHVATACNHLNIIDYLIIKGADINKKNREGLIPLHIAVIHGHLGSVKYLVEKGADIDLKDKCDVSPLLYALSITIGCPNISFRLINHCSSLAQGIDVNSVLNTLLHNYAPVICYPRAQSLALDLRVQSHKRHQKRSTYFSESKKRKLENISATKENALNVELLQGSQNLPSDISMQFEGLDDRMKDMVKKSMANINSEMPAYSFNNVAVESVNNKNLRR